MHLSFGSSTGNNKQKKRKRKNKNFWAAKTKPAHSSVGRMGGAAARAFLLLSAALACAGTDCAQSNVTSPFLSFCLVSFLSLLVRVALCEDCLGSFSKDVQFANSEERGELLALDTDCAQAPKMVGVEAPGQMLESACNVIDKDANSGSWLKVKQTI